MKKFKLQTSSPQSQLLEPNLSRNIAGKHSIAMQHCAPAGAFPYLFANGLVALATKRRVIVLPGMDPSNHSKADDSRGKAGERCRCMFFKVAGFHGSGRCRC